MVLKKRRDDMRVKRGLENDGESGTDVIANIDVRFKNIRGSGVMKKEYRIELTSTYARGPATADFTIIHMPTRPGRSMEW